MLFVKHMPEKGSREWRRAIGRLGEDIASNYLKSKGYEVVTRNYLKKWGEVDIITRKGSMWHFIEVKTVSHETHGPAMPRSDLGIAGVIRETGESSGLDSFRAEENLHPWKLKRVLRAVETYLLENSLDNAEWQIDAVTIYLNITTKQTKVRLIENVL